VSAVTFRGEVVEGTTTSTGSGEHWGVRVFGKRETRVDPAALRDVALFRGLSDAELERVADLAEPVEVDAGAVLVDQGRVGLASYLVVDGEANVYAGDQHIATVSAGAPIGEMALLGHVPRNATVVAATPMRLVAFDVRNFRRLLDESPSARARLEEIMDERAALLRDRRSPTATGEEP